MNCKPRNEGCLLEDQDDMHSFGMSIENILNNNSIEQPSIILNQLYKMNNCSICRESIIKILISQKDLSENILNELQYDCNEDIRELASNYSTIS